VSFKESLYMSGSTGSIIGAPNLALIDAITQFAGGTQAIWNTITIAIPAGLVVYATDTTALKIGDGSTLYANLPVVLYLNTVATLSSQVAALSLLVGTDVSPTSLTTEITTAINAALITAIAGVVSTIRQRLTANTTFYVTAAGSDIAGVGTGAIGAPWATLSHAWQSIANEIDAAGFQITISVDGTTYTTNTILSGMPLGSTQSIVITGVGPSTVFAGVMGNAGALHFINGANALISNMTILNTIGTYGNGAQGNGIFLENSTCTIGTGIIFGTCNTAHIAGGQNALVIIASSYTISGSANIHWCFLEASRLFCTNGSIVVTISTLITMNECFALISINSTSDTRALTFAGASNVTGSRYSLATGGIINTGTGGNQNYFPGTIPGTNDGTGSYDGVYQFDVSTPPTAPFALVANEQVTITFTNVSTIPLNVATTPGIYRLICVITTSNTTDSNWRLQPNNSNYTDAFSSWVIENSDSTTGGALTVPPFLSSTPIAGASIGTSSGFYCDLFYGPSTGDTINGIGPSLNEFLISTYTNAKMIKNSSGITGGPASCFSNWGDTTTPWTLLGTLSDVNATSISGTIIIERMA
jgi:hypothetical protein